jgi:uncharacterized damage-inducible protein DinB
VTAAVNNELVCRPSRDEYFEYYDTYIRRVPDGKCLSLLETQDTELQLFFSAVSEVDASIVHAPYGWTIKQVVGHLIDVERIFSDRLLRISSGDQQPQPGMDQDLYVNCQDYQTPNLRALLEEWKLCRRSNILLVNRLKPDAWKMTGTASGYPVSVRALLWMMVGHVTHHFTIIQQRLDRSKL